MHNTLTYLVKKANYEHAISAAKVYDNLEARKFTKTAI